MTTRDLNITILVDQTPEEVFNAINDVRDWWSEGIEGNSAKLNDEFFYQYKDLHWSRQRLTEVIPNKKVVWMVTDSRLTFIKDEKEWNGTKIIFDISTKDKKTQLQFTHEGLLPEKECFEACTGGWNYYIESLQQLITTGKGNPATKSEVKSKKEIA
jgi:hypothetical protein